MMEPQNSIHSDTVSLRNTMPYITANTGTTNVTVRERAGPTFSIKRKYKIYATPVHSTPTATSANQAPVLGVEVGQNQIVGKAKPMEAPN